MSVQFEITWIGRGGPPQQPPNPRFPAGVDLDLTFGRWPTCSTPLPYPTGRDEIGGWNVVCRSCGLCVYITAASRPDDPRSVNLACRTADA